MLKVFSCLGIFWISFTLGQNLTKEQEIGSDGDLLENLDNSTIDQSVRDKRVLGGVDARPGVYPFIVSLQRKRGSHFCAGTIINGLWVLTAAHCMFGKNIRNVEIHYGITDLRSSQGVVDIQRAIVHNGYSPAKGFINDIALLRVFQRFQYVQGRVEAVTLPNRGYEVPNYIRAVLVGWGKDITGYQQNQLHEGDLFVISDRDCNARHYGKTTSDQICGTLVQGGSRQCDGDSGGPLLLNDRMQIGIVSWSVRPCGRPPFPGVYTKVSHYLNFIALNINSV